MENIFEPMTEAPWRVFPYAFALLWRPCVYVGQMILYTRTGTDDA